jgi:hypothetical protein
VTQSAEDQDFQAQMARVQALTRQLERISDPAVQASVKELVQCMLEFNSTAINRMMEIVHKSGPHGEGIIDSLGEDPLIRSLLILYGLHPQDTATRVARALEILEPTFRKFGAAVELERVEGSIVRLRIGEVRNATVGQTLKSSIEEQIYAFAPDVTRIDGLAALAESDLVRIAC